MIIQCDFDGTIINNNLSTLLRENFAPENWQDIESDYLKGIISVEQSNKFQFALIKEPKEKLQEFVCRHIKLRAGFIEFICYCNEKRLPFVIVSSGLDFYIEPVLKKIGLHNLELYCAQTVFSRNGIEVSYYDPEGNPLDQGFKNSYLRWLQKRGEEVIYLGDGLSDLDAAHQANHVFATGNLQYLLERESITYHSFSDFYSVLRTIHHLS